MDKFNSESYQNNVEIESDNTRKSYSFDQLKYLIVGLVILFSLIAFIGYSDINNIINNNKNVININKSIKSSSSKPNIVFILADDLAWASIGFTSDGETPEYLMGNLTKLASGGIIMKNYYAQEVCSPSRAALLTGRHPVSLGMQYGMVTNTDTWGLDLDETLLPQVLSDNGYTNYAFGKWHLGNYNPQYLPTARGFDYFTGYVTGQSYYWSKKETTYFTFQDFITSNKDCYNGYADTDKEEYSTWLYTNKAKAIIEAHSESETPFFLYLAYQNVHDPFADLNKPYLEGVPSSYLPASILKRIEKDTEGKNRQEYYKSLYLMDQAVGEIYNTLESTGVMDNTYLIFASDNGGCAYAGGFSGPYRGMKGSLFEGGLKVDSFINSPLLEDSGIVYDGLFHVSDWFPTILSLIDVTYTPSDSSYDLDGVDHSSAWFDSSITARSTLLYNIYKNVHDEFFNIWKNGSFAIRNEQYKLIHAYNNSIYDHVYKGYKTTENDDYTYLKSCSQTYQHGTFTYMLYDLINDPYESTNLYYHSSSEYTAVKTALYEEIAKVTVSADTCYTSLTESKAAVSKWKAVNDYLLPWDFTEFDTASSDSYPSYCSDYSYES